MSQSLIWLEISKHHKFQLEACENYATLGEIADTLRNVFGEYKAQ